jgi:hypothetical protein
VDYLERAAQLTDYEAIIAEHLADAYLKNGQPFKALETYHRSLARAETSDTELISRVTGKIRELEEQLPHPPHPDIDTSGDTLP